MKGSSVVRCHSFHAFSNHEYSHSQRRNGIRPPQFKSAIQCQRDEHDYGQVGTSQSLETDSGESAAIEKPGDTLFHHAEQCHDHKGNGCENGSGYAKFRSTL